jgi:hypothetical protein
MRTSWKGLHAEAASACHASLRRANSARIASAVRQACSACAVSSTGAFHQIEDMPRKILKAVSPDRCEVSPASDESLLDRLHPLAAIVPIPWLTI